MNKPKLFGMLITCSLAINACRNNSIHAKESTGIFNRDSLARHIIILASDSFQGRKPFSAGEVLTVDYVQNQFSAMGLEPGNGKSFLQEVPLVQIKTEADPVL